MIDKFDQVFYAKLLIQIGLPPQPDIESAKHVIELAKNVNKYLEGQMQAIFIPKAFEQAAEECESSQASSWQFSEAQEELEFESFSRSSSQSSLEDGNNSFFARNYAAGESEKVFSDILKQASPIVPPEEVMASRITASQEVSRGERNVLILDFDEQDYYSKQKNDN